MKNIKRTFFAAVVVLLVAGGWFGYLKMTDDTYEGMSIIPEQHDDIPLFEGLEPTRSNYVIEENRWNDVYDFYFEKLPELGWKNDYVQTALDDEDSENDWGGFQSRWTKLGFEGELTISASYNKFDEQTEVMFDQTPIYYTSTWINKVPESICIYQNSNNRDCSVIKDRGKIQKIVSLINDAIDWEGKALPREKASTIDFGEIDIKVLYEKEKEVYFQSEKGLKFMKPEPEFFELTGISQ
ncbi:MULTISPECIES: hypothetical protein [unclassified Bacillus (in: firmicutes)]|uniref:hypothetical protein n=1 Tax=unclassified Bacillus (in: firmicutes) TaxID=185979 RepID=UPI0008DF1E93|nr:MULTISPECIES: hypothetical protein [unclassified Bacillus (in: firmicutes)]SFA81557.1 hypothetical protein SAMN02799634_1011041 [Bacillus sp. UNCCL13]SFQ71626.1 hypothetical protein SAMN04488577_1314 [Bacillus sp. cl95]